MPGTPEFPRPGDTRFDLEAALGEPTEIEVLSACSERLRYPALDVVLMNGVVETVVVREPRAT